MNSHLQTTTYTSMIEDIDIEYDTKIVFHDSRKDERWYRYQSPIKVKKFYGEFKEYQGGVWYARPSISQNEDDWEEF